MAQRLEPVQREYDAERAAVDEIMRRIEEEDRTEVAARYAKRAATAAYIAEFLRQQVCCIGWEDRELVWKAENLLTLATLVHRSA